MQWSINLLAQPFSARTLSIQQGLPEYYVSGLVQDKAGFIWVATRNGLARYDGYRFKIFEHHPFTNHTLESNLIRSLESVSDTTILIRFDNGGFQLFNPIAEKFTDPVTPIQLEQSTGTVFTGHEEQLWCRLAHQLVNFNRKTKHLQVHPFPESAKSHNYHSQRSILLDNRQHLFAATTGHLVEFDPKTGQFQDWANPDIGQAGQVITYYDTHLLQRKNGEIMISAVQQLLLFNPKTHRFRSIPIPGKINTQVGLVYEANDGNVYFTHAMTVYRLTTDDQLSVIWTAPRIDYQNFYHALLVDRSGVLWIGTNGNGIQQIDLQKLPIKTYPYKANFVHDILSTELGLIPPSWTETDAAIYQLRLGGTKPYVTIVLKNSFQLLAYYPNRRTLQTLFQLHHLKSRIDDSNGISFSPDSSIWMYDPFRGLINVSSNGQLLDVFDCSVRLVSSIQPLGSVVWLASEFDGLYAYDTKVRRIVKHLRYQVADTNGLISNHVLSMVADPLNPALLWIGTQEGLSQLNTRTMRFRNWTTKQGLPSACINTLLTDRQGNIWFSTLKGISRVDSRTGNMRHFSTTDGLLDTQYRQNHALALPDGRLAFGGATGTTVFDPLGMVENIQPIPTVLTSLKVENRLMESGEDSSPLRLPVNATQTLHLKYDQNFLSLEFAGLQYNKPTTLQYRYQLSGIDADWVKVGNQTLANYTRLPPGSYVFRVNTADALGNWSPLIKAINIIIDPPWWQTWWAYMVYGLLLLLLLRIYIQYRINQAQLRQEIALQEQEARLIKENADWQTRFFTNITHEFRTPLTLILGPIERLMNTSTKLSRTSLDQHYGVIYRNTQRLLVLINQLLDMAKLEAGQLAVADSQGNLPAFIAQLVDSFQPRAQKKDIEISFDSSGLADNYRFDAHKLESIVYNLLANAVKFTQNGGRIQVDLNAIDFSESRPGLLFRVSDTGPGIPTEQLPHIFDRFYQGQGTHTSTGWGTGIGLYLVSEFSKIMGGSVQVESEPGMGASFTVILPLSEADEFAPLIETIPSQPIFDAGIVTDKLLTLSTAPLVLVVEDNEELCEFIVGELSSSFRVITAANGQEGWQHCLAELPELVISDVMMPVMDGFDLLKRIKTTPLTAHIAVMLLTAKNMTEARIKGLSTGANDYLTKPFNLQELNLRIANLLDHQKQLRQHWQLHMGQLANPASPESGLKIDDSFLTKIYQVLDREITNSTFSVDQLADELAVSYRTLHRKLNTLTGVSANELIRSYRLQQAANFLREGYSISQTAEKVGFESIAYFSRSFKAQFAVSPSAYAARPKS